MAEESNVRLVRCPKCENLLPELPDYSLYQCGGCGAVLRAKSKALLDTQELSDKSNEEREKGGSEKLPIFSGKGAVSLGSKSETEEEIDGVERARKRERVFTKRTDNLINSASSRAENRKVLSDSDGDLGTEVMGTRDVESSASKEGFGNRLAPSMKTLPNKCDYGMNRVRSELVNSSVEDELGEMTSQNGNKAGLGLKSGTIADRWAVGRDGFRALGGNSRAVNEQVRYSRFGYPDEGPSNHPPGSVFGGGEPRKNGDNLDGSNRVENLEHDRAELLRKLDELKDQLSRSCDVAENPREQIPVSRRMAPGDSYGGGDTYRVSMQPSSLGKQVPIFPHFNHSHGPVPFVNGHGMDAQNFYPPMRHASNEVPGFGDPFQARIPSRPPHPPSWLYPQRPSQDYFSSQYSDIDQDPLIPHPHETFFHQLSCSCLSCYNKNWQVPPQVAPTVLDTRRFLNDRNNSNVYRHANPLPFRSRDYNRRGVNPPQLHSQDSKSCTRRPSDLDSDIGGFSWYRTRKLVVAHGNGHFCHPIAGGAPFITCSICLALLQLPKKIVAMEKNHWKLQCGACYSIILLEVENKRLIVSVPTLNKEMSAEVGSGEVLNEKLPNSHGLDAGGTNSCFDDYDNWGYNFQSIDTEPDILSKDHRFNLSDSEKREGHPYSSSISSEDEESPDSVIVQRVSNPVDFPVNDDASPPHSRSPLRDYSSNHAVSRFGKGNRSQRTNQEKVVLNKVTSRQNSLKDASVATEMEVSFNEYLNTGLSQDSVEASQEEDRPKINKGSESFFAGFIKRSFKDFSRSNQNAENGRINVFVNGQPIPDRVVKKAEKLAGPIHPGEYWYDSRAGFWGVMGQPCLGIIPPYIPEFNYRIPEKCAAGNTSVYVNGRELHQGDLDLLASRGLPTTRDKSYIIEISGRVLDEASGEELDSLGKLAPTVETMKRGFGMQVQKQVV